MNVSPISTKRSDPAASKCTEQEKSQMRSMNGSVGHTAIQQRIDAELVRPLGLGASRDAVLHLVRANKKPVPGGAESGVGPA